MKIRITAFCLLCAGVFLLLATSCFGQLTKVWENHYVSRSDSSLINLNDGNGSTFGTLQFDGAGDCYFLSEVEKPVQNSPVRIYHPQMQTIKYNPFGTTLWIHKDSGYQSGSCDQCGLLPEPYQIIVHNDGTFFGFADNNNASFSNYQNFLVSIKANGITSWDTTAFVNQYNANMAEDYKGNLIVVANSNAVWTTIVLSKVSSAGNLLWSFPYGSPGGYLQFPYPKVTTDKSGSIYVLHNSGGSFPDTADVWVSKYDTSGSLIWDKLLDSGESMSGVQPDILYNLTDSCLYVTYHITPDDNSGNQIEKLQKLTTSGVINWQKSISSINNKYDFVKLKQDKQGNVYWWNAVREYSYLPYPFKADEANIYKYNSAGTQIGLMHGNSFDVDASGYTYTTNYFFDSKTYNRYDEIRKYSPVGTLLYESPASLTNDDNYSSQVYLNNSTNLYTLKQYHNFDTVSISKYNASCSAKVAPAKPKSITGSAVMTCGGSTSYAYSIAAVAKATYYNWTVPTGVTIDSGQGTNKIYVVNNSAFKTGTISVYAANCYGASAAINKAVNDTLKIPGAITGPASVCKGQTYVQFNVAAVAGANDYEWTLPANASIVCGNHTNSICVSFGNNGGTLTVTADNSCGTTSPVRSKQVKVTACVSGMTVEAKSNQSVVYPNPSSGAFTLKLGSAGKNYNQSAVSVIVKDVSGKVVEEMKSVTTSSLSFGSRLVPGVYFVEVITGSEKQVLKVVKE